MEIDSLKRSNLILIGWKMQESITYLPIYMAAFL